jgi:guanylate kinase
MMSQNKANQIPLRQGVLLVLSGPSGTGKGTICKALLHSSPSIHYSISVTTRAKRSGERNGVNYWFVSTAEFEKLRQQEDLLEWAEVYGNYYGTPRRYVEEQLTAGHDVILEIDIQGAMKVKQSFPQGIFIYILPPSLDELEKRIIHRGTDSDSVIRQRLSCVKDELACAKNYNYVVINDVVETATCQIQSILAAEHCLISRNKAVLERICTFGSLFPEQDN